MVSHKKFPSGTVMLVVGTRRGLFLVTSQDRQRWQIEATKLETLPSRIYHATFDPRNNYRLFVADNGDFFGSFVRYSDDFGQSWHEPRQGLQFPQGGKHKLNDIWVIEPGRPDEPGVVYAGTDPASLWISTDYGETWEVNEALLAHPDYELWPPGHAGTCLHSIITDPTNPSRMWVAISGGGCLRTDDGGQSWRALNQDSEQQEIGLGSHRLIQHPTQSAILYRQDRRSIFKSLDAGETWLDIRSNLPSGFGFPLALDQHHPETLFAVVTDPHIRRNIGNQFAIYRTCNAGETWETLTNGLPSGPGVRLKVLRHALCTDTLNPCGVYAGTDTGQLFASSSRGESWKMIADYLPPIFSVTATLFV
jgi:photosystem II stability/assembly factor-like uncharacterized protein